MKKRRKPLILLGFPAEFLAFPRWFEHPTYRLGGGRSIQLSYGNIFKIYSILVLNLLNVNRLCPKGGRYNIFLGGVCSIQLSYWDIFKIYAIFTTRRNRTICRLGGVCSIQLSYWDNLNQAAVRDAGVQLPYYYKRNPAKKQDIIQSRPHSKIVWAALRLSYTEKGSTQARPSSHAAMLSAAKLIYGYRGCRFRRLLLLPLLPEVQNRYTFFRSGRCFQ